MLEIVSPVEEIGRCYLACSYNPSCFYYVYDTTTKTCLLYEESEDYFDCDIIRGPSEPTYSEVIHNCIELFLKEVKICL